MTDESLDALLKSTSRSFYLSLKALPISMRPAAGLGYMLCRTADSIADTDIIPPADRLHFLNRFFDLMDRFPASESEWTPFSDELNQINQNPKSSEGNLIYQLMGSIAAFKSLARTDQVLVQRVVQGVIQGMRMDLKVFGTPGDSVTTLPDRESLENYLNWIGGEPGRFWTDLTLAHFPNLPVPLAEDWRQDGIRFGTGLQMVNILRDFAEDLSRGRCYIPKDVLAEHGLAVTDLTEAGAHERFLPLFHHLIDETLDRLESGLRYIRGIPSVNFPLRAAVWWPLSLGVQTLAKLRSTYFILDPKRKAKISRMRVYLTLVESTVMVWSDGLLSWRFRGMKEKASS